MKSSLFEVDPEPEHGLPTPPLRLRRIRLQGVGPDGARFDPLDLDFTTALGAASRVLLSLTNTGGKSTLITLVCSLIVPAARSQVGGKILGDYVLTGDTSHVVCEWEDALTAQRMVTGTVMEWKDGRRQPPHKMRSTSNMHRAWYLFRTGPNLPSLDDLPFIDGGLRVPFRRFTTVIEDLIANYPAAQGIITDKQIEWTSSLERHTSIDPTLFSYQMRMNDAETGAEQLLRSFDSPDNVVRFFVAALNDHRELEVFTGKLDAYATLAAQRTDLEDRRNFGEAVIPLVDQLRLLAADRAAADSDLLEVVKTGGGHATALDNRIAEDTRSLDDLDEAVVLTGNAFGEARRVYGQVSDIRLQLQLESARTRVASTENVLGEAVERESRTESESEAWQAVGDVLDLRVKRERAAVARHAYSQAQAGLNPLRESVVRAAAELAGRLDALIVETTAGAGSADDYAQDAREQRKRADADKTQAEVRINELDGKGKLAKADIEGARTATLAAAGEGWIGEHEYPDECLRRWQDSRADATRGVDDAKARQDAAEQRFDELKPEIQAIADSLIELRARAQSTADKLAGYRGELVAVGTDETVVELAGGIPADSEVLARVATLAGQSAEAADARAVTHNEAAQAAHRQLESLDLTGVAPTGQDALDVLAVLQAADIGSVTGLRWIETNIADPESRAEYIRAHPEIAGGVVISDRSRFEVGIQRLVESAPHTRTPVIVTTPPTETACTPTPSFRHVVVPHRATWDRQWAADMRRTLEESARIEEERARDAVNAARRYRNCESLCDGFVRRWGAVTLADLDNAARTAAEAKDIAHAEQLRVVKAQNAERHAANEARADHSKWTSQASLAERRVTAAQSLASLCDSADKAEATLPDLDSAVRRATDDKEAAEERRDMADQSYESAVQRAANLRSDCETHRDERAKLGVDLAADDPGGNPSVLRERWWELRKQLDDAERGMLEAKRLDEAELAVGEAAGRVERYEPDTIRRATDLSDTVEASTATTLADAQLRARRAHDKAHKVRLRAENNREQALSALATAQPSGDHQNHIDLTQTEWLPATPEEIPALLERLEGYNLEMRARRDTAEDDHEEAKNLRDAVAADIDSFTHTRDMWAEDRIPGVTVFAGPADKAREVMREFVRTHRRVDKHARDAREAVHAAVARLRSRANDPRFSGLESPDAIRLRSFHESDLVDEVEVLTRRIRALTDSARDDLAQLDTHRSMLCDDLMALCRTQRRMLREVSRSSRLPAGLGDLSDHPTIKIRFDEAPAAEAMARLANRVDAWSDELVQNPRKAKSSEVRARWLADAVRDTVTNRARAGAWSIEILKPRIDGRVVYCPPDRIPHEFSGGQVLTLAVLVYCALSQVRSAHRHGGARPAGALLLDNPFGAASAEALLEMQHRLAAHTGVQLVCATGLHDPAVEAAFTGPGSVIVKLRNDGDLRRNLSFLQLRATVVDGVDIVKVAAQERDPQSTQNWVDAIKYEIRE